MGRVNCADTVSITVPSAFLAKVRSPAGSWAALAIAAAVGSERFGDTVNSESSLFLTSSPFSSVTGTAARSSLGSVFFSQSGTTGSDQASAVADSPLRSGSRW